MRRGHGRRLAAVAVAAKVPDNKESRERKTEAQRAGGEGIN